MLRKIIGIAFGALCIIGAVMLSKRWIANKTRPKPVTEKVTKTVFVNPVKNTTIPIIIPAQGNITAARRISLYAEVQGLFQSSSSPFKPGQTFQKGEYLMKIDSREFLASLKAQRSQLQDLITAMIPDLKMDYPASFPHWETYLKSFDISKKLSPLPQALSEKERYFITGRNIISTYYQVKNMEERYAKYFIKAPFKGILTSALVTEGTLVRAGQPLGEFIDPSLYELEVSVNSSYLHLLKLGEKVNLKDLEGRETWKGTVKRINGSIDQATQTVKVYIQTQGKGLREGMYLQALLKAKEEAEAMSLPRKLLMEGNQVFTVQKGKLHLAPIEPVFFSETNVVVKGLKNGTQILIRPVPGAYEGMPVKLAGKNGEQKPKSTEKDPKMVKNRP